MVHTLPDADEPSGQQNGSGTDTNDKCTHCLHPFIQPLH